MLYNWMNKLLGSYYRRNQLWIEKEVLVFSSVASSSSQEWWWNFKNWSSHALTYPVFNVDCSFPLSHVQWHLIHSSKASANIIFMEGINAPSHELVPFTLGRRAWAAPLTDALFAVVSSEAEDSTSPCLWPIQWYTLGHRFMFGLNNGT